MVKKYLRLPHDYLISRLLVEGLELVQDKYEKKNLMGFVEMSRSLIAQIEMQMKEKRRFEW